MDQTKLQAELEKVLDAFIQETNLCFNGKDRDLPATKEDIFHLSQQVVYLLDDFTKVIIEHSK